MSIARWWYCFVWYFKQKVRIAAMLISPQPASVPDILTLVEVEFTVTFVLIMNLDCLVLNSSLTLS